MILQFFPGNDPDCPYGAVLIDGVKYIATHRLMYIESTEEVTVIGDDVGDKCLIGELIDEGWVVTPEQWAEGKEQRRENEWMRQFYGHVKVRRPALMGN